MGSQRLAPSPLEAQRGRVHEHKPELAEEIPPALEQRLLDRILHAARRKSAVCRRLGLLTEPGHRPIEMVQAQIVDPRDGVVDRPLLARAVRARDHEPVKHRNKHRPFHLEAEAAPGNKRGHHSPAAALLPQPTERQRRADPAHLKARIALLDGA